MVDSSIRSKIRKIKLHTKRIMQSTLAGDYLSAFKGPGLEFDQIREYQMGDDIRFIDWNSSAKMNKIMIKQFVQERDRTVILAIDVSASSIYGSGNELRKESIAQLAASLALIADANKDKVGILFFSDHIEHWISPSRGPLHVGKIIEKIFSLQPSSTKTNLQEALNFLVKLKKRNAIVFLISDWIDITSDYTKPLRIASIEYDFVALRLLDSCEKTFPDIGLIEVKDPETGKQYLLNTKKGRQKTGLLNTIINQHLFEQKRLCDRLKIDLLDLTLGQSFVNPLIRFFHTRIRR